MTYFQNPFPSEFRGNWVVSDRQFSLTFTCPRNAGRSEELISNWNEPLSNFYDLSGNDEDGNAKSDLTIRLSIGNDFQNWTNIVINLTDNTNAGLNPVPNSSEMKAHQIVAILNSNPTFNTYFTATNGSFNKNDTIGNNIKISQKFATSRMKYFVVNTGAERVLGFNSRSGIAELPSYFGRYKVYGGDMTISLDGTNAIVELSPTNSGGASNVDNYVIDNAKDARGNLLNLDSSNPKQDWELLKGRASGVFTFQKLNVDDNDRIIEIIEYPAGARPGDFARKINYTYTGGNTNPSKVTEIPYTLTSGDLVTP